MRKSGWVSFPFLLSLLLCLCSPLSQAADASAAAPAAATPSAAANIQQQTLKDGIPIESLRNFARVLTLIQQNYVNPVSDKQLIDAAIAGMVASLDPHSAWLDSDEMEDLKELTDGSFGGLGIELGSSNGHIQIVTPLDDSPASRAGIKPGDELLEIDGKSVQGDSLDDVADKLRGAVGSKVTLTLLRSKTRPPLKITLVRDNIKLESVKSRMLAPGYGYLRITQFQDNTASDLQDALKKLEQNKPFYGLVLDLRNNPGGVFDAAVGVADTFLNQGLIVYTQGRTPDSRVNFYATPGDLLNGLPLVVLVNSGTASAAEIVAGALKDQQRAIVVGQRTFGKGSVQTVIPMDNNKALKLTIARYYTPNGRSIQAQGIEPDILLNVSDVTLDQGRDTFRESDLPHHLTNPQPAAGNTDQHSMTQLEQQDFTLYQALTLLKAIQLSQPEPPSAQGSGQ